MLRRWQQARWVPPSGGVPPECGFARTTLSGVISYYRVRTASDAPSPSKPRHRPGLFHARSQPGASIATRRQRGGHPLALAAWSCNEGRFC